MPWLRLWTDILDSEKVADLDDSTYRGWTFILLGAKRHDKNGLLPPMKRLAYWLRRPEEVVKAWTETLVSVGLLEETPNGLCVHDWPMWQPDKDATGAKRQRAYRERKKSPSGLPRPETETETETEREQSREGKERYASPLRNVTDDVTQALRRNAPVTPPPDSSFNQAFQATKPMPDDWRELARQAEEQLGDVSWALWVREQWLGEESGPDVAHAMNRCLETGKRSRSYANAVLRGLHRERAEKNGRH